MLYKNKYRTSSFRLKDWNYKNEGIYFITICTKNKANYFGEIIKIDNEIHFKATELGKVAEDEWFKSIELRKDMNLKLGEFIVMPNHVHGIIVIGKNEFNTNNSKSTDLSFKESKTLDTHENKFGAQSKNLSSLIRGYKSAVTQYARKKEIEFDWQSKFYEKIIFNSNELDIVENYIRNNRKNWHNDELFSI